MLWIERLFIIFLGGLIFCFQGENLTLASESEDPDITVRVGADKFCSTINLKSGVLTCDLPDSQPASLKGDSLPRVIVSWLAQ